MRCLARLAIFSCLLSAGPALAQPGLGGPMKHASVTFDGLNLAVEIDPGVPTPDLQVSTEPLDGPAAVLDGTAFNAQYGWNAGGYIVLPPDSAIWIEQLSATSGLRVYDQDTFEPLFGTDGSSPRWRWSGVMMHNWYAVAADDPPGDVSATYRVYLGDPTSGEPLPGYGAATTVFTFTHLSSTSGEVDFTGIPPIGLASSGVVVPADTPPTGACGCGNGVWPAALCAGLAGLWRPRRRRLGQQA